MGSIKVSEIVDYEGYSSEYAYATITWDNLDERRVVTVTITDSNVATWRIRGYRSDTTEYYVGVGGATSGTFIAPEGVDIYVFQIYTQTYSRYSDGKDFTVNFNSSDDGGDDDEDVYQLIINQGNGTKLTVYSYNGGNPLELKNGAYITFDEYIYATAKALTGYKLDYYDGINASYNGTLGYKVHNLKYHHTGEESGQVYFLLDEAGNASITSTAQPKEYKLTAKAGTGSAITVKRKSSKQSNASLGVLANGAKIYHFDVLEVSSGVESGYNLLDTVVTGCTENTDGTFTVTGNVTVTTTTELAGLVYIDNGTTFEPYLVFIDNGSDWEQYIPYLDTGTAWVLCS